jgi:hypothetical protein
LVEERVLDELVLEAVSFLAGVRELPFAVPELPLAALGIDGESPFPDWVAGLAVVSSSVAFFFLSVSGRPFFFVVALAFALARVASWLFIAGDDSLASRAAPFASAADSSFPARICAWGELKHSPQTARTVKTKRAWLRNPNMEHTPHKNGILQTSQILPPYQFTRYNIRINRNCGKIGRFSVSRLWIVINIALRDETADVRVPVVFRTAVDSAGHAFLKNGRALNRS